MRLNEEEEEGQNARRLMGDGMDAEYAEREA
jgi:hypothetical protein